MQLIKNNPFKDLVKIEHDMEKLWENGWNTLPTFAETSAMDMYREDGNLVAEVSLPGFKKQEVKVMADDGVLEVEAEHKQEKEKKTARRYYFHESSNRYFRRVTLPEGAKAEKAQASFKKGVLKVTMPIGPEKEAKSIAVN